MRCICWFWMSEWVIIAKRHQLCHGDVDFAEILSGYVYEKTYEHSMMSASVAKQEQNISFWMHIRIWLA